jgi:hypothetical protein
MNKFTALLIALLALVMMTGTSMAAEMTGGEKTSSVTNELLWKQLSPNAFGTEYFADGVSYDEFRGTMDKHYGVAPAWEGRPEESLTMVEKAERELRKHIAPNTIGTVYFTDGVSYEEFRGPIDRHYGIAPAWEDMPDESLTRVERVERELRRHLAPNEIYGKDVN